ncbi:HpcH/HpaI aldolase/citrate lyase family protein [Paracoccus beibuensis]|uniref:HpcH/HpaI aldolase/citrate lyase family protein n=1 Tax=Paracoccus beibuensis TaxID=547602 RepID=UPI0022407A26|nr:CoA ester lyase [Paracoccus beibuensis]
MARPYRSVLYIPAANVRAMEKARDLPADAIIFDLEDAVAPDAKAHARQSLAGALAQDYGARARIVRINAFATEWGRDDAKACAGLAADAVLVPKVDGPQDLDRVAEILPDTPLWAMMETPLGMLNAAAIAAHPRLRGMVMGTNDLAKELGSRTRSDRLPMMAGLGLCILAARAHRRVIVDGVFNAFRDEDGLRAECEQGRDMGFDGKTLIHPAQLEAANAVFAPTDAEVDLARRQLDAFDRAKAEGRGVAVVDGRIVENLHAATARLTLDRAQAIAALTQ